MCIYETCLIYYPLFCEKIEILLLKKYFALEHLNFLILVLKFLDFSLDFKFVTQKIHPSKPSAIIYRNKEPLLGIQNINRWWSQ